MNRFTLGFWCKPQTVGELRGNLKANSLKQRCMRSAAFTPSCFCLFFILSFLKQTDAAACHAASTALPVTRSLSGPITAWLPSALNSMLPSWEVMSRFWVCPRACFAPGARTTKIPAIHEKIKNFLTVKFSYLPPVGVLIHTEMYLKIKNRSIIGVELPYFSHNRAHCVIMHKKATEAEQWV